jgi:hypothetical protein
MVGYCITACFYWTRVYVNGLCLLCTNGINFWKRIFNLILFFFMWLSSNEIRHFVFDFWTMASSNLLDFYILMLVHKNSILSFWNFHPVLFYGYWVFWWKANISLTMSFSETGAFSCWFVTLVRVKITMRVKTTLYVYKSHSLVSKSHSYLTRSHSACRKSICRECCHHIRSCQSQNAYKNYTLRV